MKSRFLIALLLLALSAVGQYKIASPGYRYEFPRDNFDHPDYATEWWYYTGNVKDSSGRRFGYELTFFRQGVDRTHPQASPWTVRDIYLAHLAISDVQANRFFHEERINRLGPGLAGIEASSEKVWNGNWQATISARLHKLTASAGAHSIELQLVPTKPAVIHGQNGVSKKSAGEDAASHYVSYTRLATTGKIVLEGKQFEVSGTSWMDHEFFTSSADESLVGWDWLSLQLDDGADVMLYRLRNKDGSVGPFSSGTYISADGHSTYFGAGEFTMQPSGREWKSKVTGATYPIAWHVVIPRFGLDLNISTPLDAQELAGNNPLSPSYWEGAIDVTGSKSGVGYLEMTGYAKPLVLSH